MERSEVIYDRSDRARGDLDFLYEAKRAFAFLESELGFTIAIATDTLVRYVSSEVFVNVYHGRSSYELRFEIGLLSSQSKYYPEEVVAMQESDRPTYFQASTHERVITYLPKLAEILHSDGRQLLAGDRAAFKRLQEIRVQLADESQQRDVTTIARTKATLAWREKDYHSVIGALTSIEKELTPSERLKLLHALHKTRQAN